MKASQEASNQEEIVPIAIPGIHERFFGLFQTLAKQYKNPKVLETGAGHGAFTKKLHDEGYDVHANDLFPEYFKFKKMECIKVDLTDKQPYEDNTFDIILAIEVMEHIHDHNIFFKECNRILKPGGIVVISTPNILSLKSRVRFLYSGFFYSFQPLKHEQTDGLQHISSLTIDQYKNLGFVNKFSEIDVKVDRKQSTSKIYSVFLVPMMWLYCKVKKIDFSVHNQWEYMTGRVLFMIFKK